MIANGTNLAQIENATTATRTQWMVTEPMDTVITFRVEDTTGTISESEPLAVTTGLPMYENGTCVTLLQIGWSANVYISWGFPLGVQLAIGAGLGTSLFLVALLAIYLTCCMRPTRFQRHRYGTSFGNGPSAMAMTGGSFDNTFTVSRTGNTVVTYTSPQEPIMDDKTGVDGYPTYAAPTQPPMNPYAAADNVAPPLADHNGNHPYATIKDTKAGHVSRSSSIDHGTSRPRLEPRVETREVPVDDDDDELRDEFPSNSRGGRQKTLDWREALMEAPAPALPRPSMGGSPPNYNSAIRSAPRRNHGGNMV